MEDVIEKIKEEIKKKIEGHKLSLDTHHANEDKLMRELERNREKQALVHTHIAKAMKELGKLDDYKEWKNQ
ncbi:hypothetical protein [Lederbergia lenta]|uniref:hypothetical protein n=1 Tax=Lederbergia lenta TaxID=1467 RepID=UPI00203D8AD5|nr:hypothetical protein [Lederbergia lenta]MCM3109920.1 hypothetical protein [Lederbergia lenta]